MMHQIQKEAVRITKPDIIIETNIDHKNVVKEQEEESLWKRPRRKRE